MVHFQAQVSGDSWILDIPTLVAQDMCSFLEQPSGVPLSAPTREVLEILCEPIDKAFSVCSAALQLVVSQLYTFYAKSTEQREVLIQKHNDLQRGV